jgi:hypothetical protein
MKKKHSLPKAAEPYKFKPGVSGNPKGRPPLNPIQRALKNLTIQTYRDVIEEVCTGNLDNLKAIADNPKSSALQAGIAIAFAKALKAGDYATIERIAERIVGKIPDELNINSKNLNANLNAPIDEKKLKAVLEKLESDF